LEAATFLNRGAVPSATLGLRQAAGASALPRSTQMQIAPAIRKTRWVLFIEIIPLFAQRAEAFFLFEPLHDPQ